MYERVRDSITRKDDGAGELAGGAAPQQQNANAAPGGQAARGTPEGNYQVERAATDGRSFEEASAELSERVRRDELDGYLILPPDILQDGEVRVLRAQRRATCSRATRLRDRISRAVRDQRMDDENIVLRVDTRESTSP